MDVARENERHVLRGYRRPCGTAQAEKEDDRSDGEEGGRGGGG